MYNSENMSNWKRLINIIWFILWHDKLPEAKQCTFFTGNPSKLLYTCAFVDPSNMGPVIKWSFFIYVHRSYKIGPYRSQVRAYNSTYIEKISFPIGKACLPTTIFQGRAVKTSGGYPLTTPFITLDFCWRWLDKIPELFPKWWWKMVFYHSRIRKNITLNKQTTVSRRGPKQFWRTFENNSLRNSKYRLFSTVPFLEVLNLKSLVFHLGLRTYVLRIQWKRVTPQSRNRWRRSVLGIQRYTTCEADDRSNQRLFLSS